MKEPDIVFSATAASVALIAAAIYFLFGSGCTKEQIRTAETAADIALAGTEGACVRIHDEDVDAGAVLAIFCRAESTLSASLGDAGFAAINQTAVLHTVSSIETSSLVKDAGRE